MRAITIGGAMVDTIAIVESERIERMTMRNADTAFLLLEEGRKTEALEISAHVGGGAVNVAVAMARLGLDVSTLVKLGRDARAEIVLQRLMSEGVSTRWVVRDARAPTGASVMISSHERDAAIFTFRGANTLLEACDVTADGLAVDLVYVSSLSNQSADCFPDIVSRARKAGAFVAANPGLRQLSARGGAFLESLPHLDLLTINRSEADVLVPALVARFGEGGATVTLEPGETPPPLLARGLSSGGFELTLAGFMAAMHASGVHSVAVTDGGRGAYLSRPGELSYCATVSVPVMGTAGAGDAFAATLSVMLAEGRGAGEALVAASHNAASVIGHVDTQSGLLSREEIAARAGSGEPAVRAWPC
ncbi:MAG: carbohydrate kinase family protein [Rhizobiales bacterium]|nr:carbohydrate kinase family protein [Hyphomicrobiales bacterium]